MIELHGVSKRYGGGSDALSEVNLTLPSGSMNFLTGHSGAGKSTLLRLLLRLELPTRGQVVVDGVNLQRMPRRRVPAYRQQIGVVFQDPHLLADRSVFDNVALPLVIAGFRRQDQARRVRAALTRVGLLHKEQALPETLSTGEAQRVGIARAVVNRPTVLLADEPTGNLDPGLSREVMDLFHLFNQVGVTVLIATHDLELVTAFDARVLKLHAGRLVDAGDPDAGEADAAGAAWQDDADG